MDALIGAGLLSGIGSLGSSLIGNTLGMKSSKELMDYQYMLNQKAINEANQYNLPANQMKRLEQAGLNPNLVYGHGVDGNQASPANVSGVNRDVRLANPLQDLSTNLVQKKQLELQEIANRNAAFLSRAQLHQTEAKTLGILLDNEFNDRTMEDRVKMQYQNLLNRMQENDELQARTALLWEQGKNVIAKTENLYQEYALLKQKTNLTQQQCWTEAVKRDLYRSNIRLNDKKIKELGSYMAFLDAGTDLRSQQYDIQDLEYEASKAYKEWRKNHPNASLTLDLVEKFLGLGSQAAGAVSKFIP